MRGGMKMVGFNVTFERWTHEDVEAGETDDRGFVVENVSLREAIQGGLEYHDPKASGCWEPDSSGAPGTCRWMTFYDWNNGTRDRIERGIHEQRSLHFPEHVTPASRARIARLFSL